MTLATVMVTLGLAAVAAGVVVCALRRRRVGTEPRCAGCGYDLSGQRVLTPGAVCSECGRDVSRLRGVWRGSWRGRLGGRGGVRRGVRRRMGFVGVAGAALIIAGLASIGGGVVVHEQNADLNPYKPVWLLALEVRWRGEERARAAMDEIAARDLRGELLGTEVNRAVEAALAMQRRGFQRWDFGHGGVVMRAAVDGNVTDNQWGRFVEGAVDLRVTTSRRWPVDRQLALGLAVQSVRDAGPWGADAPEGGLAELRHVLRLEVFEVDGRPVSLLHDAQPFSYRQRTVTGTGFSAKVEGVETGTREVRAVWRFDLVRDADAPAERGNWDVEVERLSKLPLLHSWSWEWAGTVEAVPPGGLPVALVENEEFGARLRDGAVIRDLAWTVSGMSAIGPDGSFVPRPAVMLRVEFPDRPMDVAFTAYLRPSGDPDAAEVRAGPVVLTRGQRTLSGGRTLVLPAGTDTAALGTVDVILRADPTAAARENPDIDEIWEGELVFRDVPINAHSRGTYTTFGNPPDPVWRAEGAR